MLNCYHCGNEIIENEMLVFDDKKFCCKGCQTVYELFSDNGLTSYYEFEKSPVSTSKDGDAKFNCLEHADIVSRLLDFQEGSTQNVRLHILHILRSSCSWVLENFNS